MRPTSSSSYAQMMHSYASRPRSPAPSGSSSRPHSPAQQQRPMVYSFDQQFNPTATSSPARQYSTSNHGGSLLPDTPPPKTATSSSTSSSSYYNPPHLKSSSPSRYAQQPTNFGSASTDVIPAPELNFDNFENSNNNTPSASTDAYQRRMQQMYSNHHQSPSATSAYRASNRSGLVMSPATGSRSAPPPPPTSVENTNQNHHDIGNAPPSSSSREASMDGLPPQPQQSSTTALPTPTAHPMNSTSTRVTFVGNDESNNTNAAALDSVLAESRANKRAADNMMHDYKKLQATHREQTRTLSERVRTLEQQSSNLEQENTDLRRQIAEQHDTISRMRDQAANFTKTRSNAERLRGENSINKERIKELETKVAELETAKATLSRRLDEKERAVTSRSGDVNALRTKLHNKEETVATLSDSLTNRDTELAKLKVEYQHVATQLGEEKQQRLTDVAKLENIILEGKERELNLRHQAHELQSEIEILRRARDEYWQEAETQKMRAIQQAKQATRTLMSLEEASRSFHEVFFAYMTEDHCAKMQEVMWQSGEERTTSRKTMARLLDDTDQLVRELDYAQDTARTEVDEKQVLGSEVRDVCDMSTEMMRSLEAMTSSASWRRAMLETLIPDEINNLVGGIRKTCAEVVHRTGMIAKRALKK